MIIMESLIFKGFNFEILQMQILPGYALYVRVNIGLLLQLVGQTVKTENWTLQIFAVLYICSWLTCGSIW